MVSTVTVKATLTAVAEATAWLPVSGFAHRKSVGRDYYGIVVDDTASFTGRIQLETRFTDPTDNTTFNCIAFETPDGSTITTGYLDFFDTLPTMEVRAIAKSDFVGSAAVMVVSGAER